MGPTIVGGQELTSLWELGRPSERRSGPQGLQGCRQMARSPPRPLILKGLKRPRVSRRRHLQPEPQPKALMRSLPQPPGLAPGTACLRASPSGLPAAPGPSQPRRLRGDSRANPDPWASAPAPTVRAPLPAASHAGAHMLAGNRALVSAKLTGVANGFQRLGEATLESPGSLSLSPRKRLLGALTVLLCTQNAQQPRGPPHSQAAMTTRSVRSLTVHRTLAGHTLPVPSTASLVAHRVGRKE